MDRVILPDADWRHRPGLDRLAMALGAGEGDARFVGGAVRDTLLGLPVADVDIATRHVPEAVVALLKGAGIKTVPTGIDHGTVTAVLDSGAVEVTTLRRDVSTDGRHATVAFTDDWREDAARRDFTFNALYADPISGQVFDYFDGLADLEVRHVRFIGDPLQRIAEDHLRILRFFRFLARFGDTPDPAGLDACTQRANDLMALSRERIADELLKLLVTKDAVHVLGLMIERGILKPVLPEIALEGVKRLDRLVSRERQAGVAPDAVRRLGSLLAPDSEIAESVAIRLKLSTLNRKALVSAVVPLPTESPRELAYRLGREFALTRWLMADQPDHVVMEALADVSAWSVPRFPLTGGAIVARGISAGPEVARLLRQVEDQWVAEGFPDAARVNQIADEVVAQALRSAR